MTANAYLWTADNRLVIVPGASVGSVTAGRLDTGGGATARTLRGAVAGHLPRDFGPGNVAGVAVSGPDGWSELGPMGVWDFDPVRREIRAMGAV